MFYNYYSPLVPVFANLVNKQGFTGSSNVFYGVTTLAVFYQVLCGWQIGIPVGDFWQFLFKGNDGLFLCLSY